MKWNKCPRSCSYPKTSPMYAWYLSYWICVKENNTHKKIRHTGIYIYKCILHPFAICICIWYHTFDITVISVTWMNWNVKTMNQIVYRTKIHLSYFDKYRSSMSHLLMYWCFKSKKDINQPGVKLAWSAEVMQNPVGSQHVKLCAYYAEIFIFKVSSHTSPPAALSWIYDVNELCMLC